MKVVNMQNGNGRGVPNQFVIYGAVIEIEGELVEGTMFQSYESNIAFKPYNSDVIYLGDDWEYSVTTGKYRNLFLGIDKKELQQRIKSGRAVILEGM
jgi:hypothetical protein